MKILIANRTLSLLAGSETWSYTLALAFKKTGHEVYGFSPELGAISNKLEEEGIQCFDKIEKTGPKPFSIQLTEGKENNYDVIIANHFHIVDYLRSQFPDTPIISTIHGIIHETDNGLWAPEHPAVHSGVNKFVAVSEEVQQVLLDQYALDSIVIRNFFDLKKYSKQKINKKPKQFLINSNYTSPGSPEVEIIKEVAKHYGARVAALGMNFVPSFDTTKAIRESDIVVGMGRSVLEGVAMGRLGIVHGRWGTGGVINEDSVEELRLCNFSGRGGHKEGDYMFWTKEMFIEEIDKYYNDTNFTWGVNYMSMNHNADLTVSIFESIARDLISGSKEPETVPMKKLKLQSEMS